MRRNPGGTACRAALLLALAGSPAVAGVPYTTDDPGTPAQGDFEINVVSQYIAWHGEAAGTLSSLEVNYGITDRFQSHIYIPVGFDRPAAAAASFGVGDAELGFKYRFIDGDELGGWQVGVAPSLEIPPARLSRQFESSKIDASLPLLVAKQWGQWTAFGEAAYAINPGSHNRDWEFTGIAIAYDINSKITVGGELLYTTAAVDGGKNGAGFNLTGTYNINQTYHLLLAVGRNITNAAVLNQFTVLAGIQITF